MFIIKRKKNINNSNSIILLTRQHYHQLFNYQITFVKSQLANTNSKGYLGSKTGFKRWF